MLEQIASVATAVGVLLVAPQLRFAQRQRHRAFEDLYLQRYWSLADKLSIECDPGRAAASTGILEQDEGVLRAYLRLCEDQIEMRKLGWVTRETWRLWADGIRANVSSWPYQEVWKTVQAEDRDDHHCLRAMERHGFHRDDYDPIQLGAWARWARGLDGLRTAFLPGHP